jgi:hypothetical protein
MSWQDFLARHDVGDVIEGVVTKHVPFGSSSPKGFTGLAHQQSWPVGTRVSVRTVQIVRDLIGEHAEEAIARQNSVLAFLASRFAGTPATDTC